MKLTLFILITLFFITCKKPSEEKTNYDFSNYGVFVVNEGNFTYGNASLSFIDFEDDTIYNQVFYKATTYPLGDVAQSITLWNNLAFVVINNSGKIYIINSITAEYVGTIKNLSSPRYVEIISDNKAYVSDLYSNTITIVNPLTYEITGSINVGTPTETMIKWHDFVFVANWNQGNKIFKINTLTDKVDTSIVVNYQPNSLVIDKNNKLWVLCDGGMDVDTSKNDFPALICIDLVDLRIEKSLIFSNKLESPTHLNINPTLDTLYYLNSSWSQNISNGGVFKMSINQEQLPNNAFIAENNRLFYSFGIGKNDEIIVSDAVDFAKEGSILLYSKRGNQIKTFKAGIIPGYFMFNE